MQLKVNVLLCPSIKQRKRIGECSVPLSTGLGRSGQLLAPVVFTSMKESRAANVW